MYNREMAGRWLFTASVMLLLFIYMSSNNAMNNSDKGTHLEEQNIVILPLTQGEKHVCLRYNRIKFSIREKSPFKRRYIYAGEKNGERHAILIYNRPQINFKD